MALFSLDGIQVQTPADGDYWVAPNAVVVGNVLLEDEASVWFGAVLRGDNDRITVGRRSNVQDCSVLHTDLGMPLVIAENCTIGHSAILHSCRIGNNSLIGMGATILNGAVIGENCLVGANALVPEGKEFAAGSLIVGAPARVIRQLGEHEIARMSMSADIYVANWRRFAKGMKPQG